MPQIGGWIGLQNVTAEFYTISPQSFEVLSVLENTNNKLSVYHCTSRLIVRGVSSSNHDIAGPILGTTKSGL